MACNRDDNNTLETLPGYRHRELLDRRRADLVSLIRVSEQLLNYMTEKGIIGQEPRQSIQSANIEHQRARQLLDYLKQRPEADFEAFLTCMQKDNQGHVFQETPSCLFVKGSSRSANLKAALQQFHTREFHKVRFVPWDEDDCCPLSDLYVSLAWEKEYRKAASIKKAKLDHYIDILSPIKGRPIPHRIFVLGEPGIGKSTFCKKIALDWALGVHEVLGQFQQLLVIPLRVHMVGHSIGYTVWHELLHEPKGLTPEDIMDEVEECGQTCLIVLDGLDEVKEKSQNIVSILEKKVFNDNRIIITTRPTGSGTVRKADVTAQILGFEPSGEITYMKKFFGCEEEENYEDEAYQMYEKCDEEIYRRGFQGISRVPLLLHLLCILFQNDGQLPETLTGVFCSLKRYVLKRHKSVMAEMGHPVQESHLQSLMDNLCEVAYRGIISENLIFKKGELRDSKHLLALGFLSSWGIPGNMEEQDRLSFIHKSFQEFFAAEYIVHNFDKTDNLWTYLDSRQKVLALKMMFSMCCGLAPNIGLKLQEKLQNLWFMSVKKILYPFQVHCLCEVTTPLDIKDIQCLRKLYIIDGYAPSRIHFKPNCMHVENSHVHCLDKCSLIVSPMDSLQSTRKLSFSTDRLGYLTLENCGLSKDACQSLCHILTERNNSLNRDVGIPAGQDQVANTMELVIRGGYVEDTVNIIFGAICTESVDKLELDRATIHMNECITENLSTSLHIVKLKWCELGVYILHMLFSLPELHTLDLSGSPLTGKLSTILFGLHHQTNLRALYFSMCDLTKWDIKALGHWLCRAPFLGTINLRGNPLSDEDLTPLMEAVSSREHTVNIMLNRPVVDAGQNS